MPPSSRRRRCAPFFSPLTRAKHFRAARRLRHSRALLYIDGTEMTARAAPARRPALLSRYRQHACHVAAPYRAFVTAMAAHMQAVVRRAPRHAPSVRPGCRRQERWVSGRWWCGAWWVGREACAGRWWRSSRFLPVSPRGVPPVVCMPGTCTAWYRASRWSSIAAVRQAIALIFTRLWLNASALP